MASSTTKSTPFRLHHNGKSKTFFTIDVVTTTILQRLAYLLKQLRWSRFFHNLLRHQIIINVKWLYINSSYIQLLLYTNHMSFQKQIIISAKSFSHWLIMYKTYIMHRSYVKSFFVTRNKQNCINLSSSPNISSPQS